MDSNKKLAKQLRSAASALEHGRKSSATAKLKAIAEELSKVEATPILFVEGGILQTVLVIDPKAKGGYRELQYELVDYDVFDGSSDDEIAETWTGFSAELQKYFETNLKDEREKFLAAVNETSKPSPESRPNFCKHSVDRSMDYCTTCGELFLEQ